MNDEKMTTPFIRGSQWKTKGGWWAVVISEHIKEGDNDTFAAWHEQGDGQRIRQYYYNGKPYFSADDDLTLIEQYNGTEAAALKSRIAELTSENNRLTAQGAAADGMREALIAVENSDMAQREEDEGNTSFTLDMVRSALSAYDNAKKVV